MQFRVLGPFEIVTDDHRLFPIGASKTGQVLALLLAMFPETVGVDTLIEELWGENPPRSALTTLQTYVYHARRILDRVRLPANSPSNGRHMLVTQPNGYAVEASADDVDAQTFRHQIKQGATLLDGDRPHEALCSVQNALQLWRGPAFLSISRGRVLDAHATHLDELRIRAFQLRVEAERRLGRCQELVPELRSLVTMYPLNEWFHAQVIELLYQSGRRAEALQAYHHLRTMLRRELGIDPNPDIQRLQLEVLAGRPVRDSPGVVLRPVP